MIPDIYDASLIQALSPSSVAAWLIERGFKSQGQYGSFGALYSRQGDEAAEVILPTSRSNRDFVRRMIDLINEVSRSDDRPPADVLTDFTLAPFDVVRVRAPDADAYGSVRLSKGVDLHDEARNLLLSAANAAASPVPRRVWRGRRSDEVSHYLDAVRLGQSQRGSFVLTLLSPWNFADNPLVGLDLSYDNFGRRVTTKLADALTATDAALQQAVTTGKLDPLVTAFSAGVSANFCLALSELAHEGEGVDVSVTWSPSRAKGMPVRLSLQRDDASILASASKELSRRESDSEVEIEGMITGISGEAGAFDGSALIEYAVGNRVRRVRVKFGESERKLVFDAARDKRWVRVIGDLANEGARLVLRNPRQVDLVEAEGD